MTESLHTPTFRLPWVTASLLLAALTLGHTSLHSTPYCCQHSETMANKIDPASDALGFGRHGRDRAWQPSARARTAAQWQAVVGHAQVLVEGARHLQRPGIPVGADAHSRLADADTPGTRTAADIRADIDAAPARFRTAAHRLELASAQALAAARRHDPQGLITAGAAIDAACEACHAAYWYPRTPSSPSPPEDFGAQAFHP
jgi:hypothetical protein